MSDSFYFQHDTNRTAFEDARCQMDDIVKKIKEKNAHISDIQTKLEKNKLEASEACKMEQVVIFVSYRSSVSCVMQ